MPTSSTTRVVKTSPYWRTVSGPKKSVPSFQSATVPPRSGISQAQFNNRIGQQLLRTLVQSLPSATQNIRSRSNCTHSFRRRMRPASCRSLRTPESAIAPLPTTGPYQTKPNVKLTTGVSVRPVAGKDRKAAGASDSQYAQKSIDTIIKRRQENPAVKAKAREEEFERIPPARSAVASPVAESPETGESEKSPPLGPLLEKRANAANPETASKTASQKSSIPTSQLNSRNISNFPSRRESQDKEPQSNFCEDVKKANFCEDAKKANFCEEAKKASESLEGGSIEKESKESAGASNMKIFPCFRGDYPTRHRPDSYQWFQAAGPSCGNIMTICDEDQQLMGETEIMTSCEVTEAHFLSIDCDDDGDNTTGPPCTKCQESTMWTSQAPTMFAQQQQQQMPQQRQQQMPQQQQTLSWFGSNSQQGNPYMQQNSMQQLQQQPFMQKKQGRMQNNMQQHPCMQQQHPYMQQQQQQMNYMPRPGCGQGNMQPSIRSCDTENQMSNQYSCSSQMPQEKQQMLQKMQYQQQDQNCLTELLAQELKQQMQDAQAQIAQVQLQLNSACGATRVRKMHVLTQNGTEDPSWSPTTQFFSSVGKDSIDLEDGNLGRDEDGVDDDMNSCFAPCSQGNYGQQLQPSQQQVMPGSCPGIGMPSQSGMSFPYCYPGQQNQQQPMQLGIYPVPISAPDQSQMFQQRPCPGPGRQPNAYPTEFSLMQQQQQPMPGCPSQQQPNGSTCSQQQNPGQQSQSSMCHFCPSCYCQRYAQMRFMMPRCWPR
ncbi:uncharacterized protein Dana_GF10867 [Drosophila ananassae]|uniref:Uncharacterized protein n=1 Tax=Drosophila ananassae TaxID=7217 RepID=B3M9C8_DROAN|nr:RNA polymerase II degradation factor 1 [Drosophila ananassae]EDV41141.1 uncharacterized protein Dana_GF10867 [Drosophila ananassae]